MIAIHIQIPSLSSEEFLSGLQFKCHPARSFQIFLQVSFTVSCLLSEKNFFFLCLEVCFSVFEESCTRIFLKNMFCLDNFTSETKVKLALSALVYFCFFSYVSLKESSLTSILVFSVVYPIVFSIVFFLVYYQHREFLLKWNFIP